MHPALRPLMFPLLLAGFPASAQTVVELTQAVASDSPEGWAMRYFAGTTLMTSLGATPRFAPWRGRLAADLGGIPKLDERQRQAGFGGFKEEDFNKAPVFGRLRGALALPGEWVAELGYTPSVEVDGVRARNLVSFALGRRLLEEGRLSLSLRALGQVGKIEGDITCPARLAGNPDPAENPYGCRSPSKDAFTTDHYGADATLGWDAGDWKWHASAGLARARLSVQVDAEVFTTRDRTKLTSEGNIAWLTAGVRYAFDPKWSVAAEVLHVPLEVKRPPDYAAERDSLTTWRLQLVREFE